MTSFRQLCCLAALLLTLFLACPLSATIQPTATESTAQQLQQENAALQRRVRRLESQVAAQREELNSPGATQIIAGIGYIVGIFGIIGWLAARKKSAQENS